MERVQHITATFFLDKDQDHLALLAVEDRSEVSARIRSARQELAKRIETEETLRKAIAEKEFLMRELNHRVKNNLSMILSMISLQQETVESESFRSTLEDLDGRIRSFSLLHEMLYKSPDTTNIRLDIYVGNIVREMFESLRNPDSGAVLETEIEAIELPFQSALYLGLIASEALTNAIKYAINNRSGGFITISVKALPEGLIELRVRDDGPGFKPGLDPMSGDSLGMKLIRLLATELKGKLSFNTADDSSANSGVELLVRFSTGI
jgi:two-component sensor histidine kinase